MHAKLARAPAIAAVLLVGGLAHADEVRPTSNGIRLEISEECSATKHAVLLELVEAVAIATTCDELVLDDVRSPTDIRITVRGLRSLPGLCVQKEPPRPRAEIDLSALDGRRSLVIASGGKSDRYDLVVDKDKIALAPVGKPAFTSLDHAGERLRVGGDWLWLSAAYSDAETKQRLQPKVDAVIAAIEAKGAKRATPARGVYANDALAWQRLAPTAPAARPLEDYVYFECPRQDLAWVRELLRGMRPYAHDDRHPRRGYVRVDVGSTMGQLFNSN